MGNEHQHYRQIQQGNEMSEETERLKAAFDSMSALNDDNGKLADKWKALAGELRLALQVLYEETAEYITINHLGDVHHNQSMKLAREALAKAREAGL